MHNAASLTLYTSVALMSEVRSNAQLRCHHLPLLPYHLAPRILGRHQCNITDSQFES